MSEFHNRCEIPPGLRWTCLCLSIIYLDDCTVLYPISGSTITHVLHKCSTFTSYYFV